MTFNHGENRMEMYMYVYAICELIPPYFAA